MDSAIQGSFSTFNPQLSTLNMEIIVNNVKKTFGEKVALNIDKYIIHQGEVIGLVGNNGAGKTTLFRVMLDLLKADSGEVQIGGYNTAECEDWKDFTGAFLDSGFLIDYLTPEEYFRFIAKVQGIGDEELQSRLSHFDSFMGGEVMGQNKLIRNLSAGNQQKVGIISAMIARPKILLLDEPFNFLDPSSQMAMKYLLEGYNRESGATIIVSSHNLNHTFDICTRVTLLEHGKIIKDYDKDYAELTSEIEDYFKGNVLETNTITQEVQGADESIVNSHANVPEVSSELPIGTIGKDASDFVATGHPGAN